MSHLRVLFVDDNRISSLINCMVLRESGYDVVEAFCAREAKAMLASAGPVSALITDIDLGPGEDGFAIALEARRTSPELPVIYVSGTGRSQFATDGVAGSEFIGKPYHPQAMVEALDRLLAHNDCSEPGRKTLQG